MFLKYHFTLHIPFVISLFMGPLFQEGTEGALSVWDNSLKMFRDHRRRGREVVPAAAVDCMLSSTGRLSEKTSPSSPSSLSLVPPLPPLHC